MKDFGLSFLVFIFLGTASLVAQDKTFLVSSGVMPRKAVNATRIYAKAYKMSQAKNYARAYRIVKRVVKIYPNDTALLRNTGVWFAPLAGKDEASIGYLVRYKLLGGRHPDADAQLLLAYIKINDYESAQGIAKGLLSVYPSRSRYLELAYNVYVKNDRVAEAKEIMEKKVTAYNKDKESRYFLGLICYQMKDTASAKLWMTAAVRIDENYFDADLAVAKLMFNEALVLKNKLASAKDKLGKAKLLIELTTTLTESLVFWERCTKLKPADPDVLSGSLSAYEWLSGFYPKYKTNVSALKEKIAEAVSKKN